MQNDTFSKSKAQARIENYSDAWGIGKESYIRLDGNVPIFRIALYDSTLSEDLAGLVRLARKERVIPCLRKGDCIKVKNFECSGENIRVLAVGKFKGKLVLYWLDGQELAAKHTTISKEVFTMATKKAAKTTKRKVEEEEDDLDSFLDDEDEEEVEDEDTVEDESEDEEGEDVEDESEDEEEDESEDSEDEEEWGVDDIRRIAREEVIKVLRAVK